MAPFQSSIYSRHPNLNPQEIAWLPNDEEKIKGHEAVADFAFLPGRPVKFGHFSICDFDDLFTAIELLLVLSHDIFEQEYYLQCMRLFDANLGYVLIRMTHLYIRVEGVEIRMTNEQFGGILYFPTVGEDLEDVETFDSVIIQQNFHRRVGVC